MKRLIISLCIISLLSIILGCESDNPAQKEKKGSDEVRYLSIKGSDTMVHLVSAWAEEFMKLRPDAELSVTGGGSGTGIAGLINGTTDICASSRMINRKELDLATDRKVTPAETSVAMDGIAVIVHPQNPITSLSLKQLEEIFTGKIINWHDLGGGDRPLLVFSRESSSGTYVFFQEHVMNRQDYTPRARLLPGTSALVQAVAADAGAIGYVGLGYANEAAGKVKTVSIRSGDAEASVAPSDTSVQDGTYPIARPLFLYSNGEPRGTVKDFLAFTLSEQGQRIVRETGYVPVAKLTNNH